ncbi:MAG TPA: tripartite tricarboxylate transporter substrate binding protein [Polaromonas sp.]|uniref:Bug family tripartite tricarboxylate transporter substrate binding protein n=1 Tax=Polaromonas sp. TaxID=1869339 RepID=UPI002D5B12B5|nr:tripartite tricarboxylate transporter substrate binding protein [Polaromonas sp.]HYW58130.1 tripartite tricarboxylate transporter substrate binding protein [Polaromonas sp.]
MKKLALIFLRTATTLAVVLLSGTAALAQEWPTRPVRVIVPYPAGGAADSLARNVGKKMGEFLGQPVMVENRPGASGTIGIAEGAKSPADGYTLTLVAVPYVITQFVYPKLPYDGAKDFIPLGLLQLAPLVLVVHPSLNIKTPAEYIQAAKAKPGQITYATSGSGSVTHMAGELLKLKTGADIVPIPYRGGGQSITDVIGGQVSSAFLSPVEVNQHIKSGAVIAVGTTSLKRPGSAAQIPTFAEAGVADYDVSGWFGLVVKSGTPPAVMTKLSSALQRALQSPEVREKIAATGEVTQGSVEEFRDLLAREYPRWSHAVKAANIKAD